MDHYSWPAEGDGGALLEIVCRMDGAGPRRVRNVARMVIRGAEQLLLLLLSRSTNLS